MAYGNMFPLNYYQPQPQMFQSPQQQNNGIIWVQGEAGAKSYLVAPNNTVQLWDSEKQTIYLKSADASGMPSMKTLDYTIRDMAQPAQPISVDTTNYATKDDLKNLYNRIEALEAALSNGGMKDE